MTSVIRGSDGFDSAENGQILQVVTDTHTGLVTTTNSSNSPTSTSGGEIFNTSFTPKRANSVILVMTSTISISEEINSANIGWLGAWAGTAEIAITSGTPNYTTALSNLNVTHLSLNNTISSWGTTSRLLTVRAGMETGSHSVYINGQSYTSLALDDMKIGLTIMEIAA